ncbi:helix-turn-helix domain-containing protein [Pararhodobacter zhoushanensis]|uniref:Helix-turn-helix domain-containing protein n=1 Tax=Pararhodobacter zhoushanensis TaxID=2479545 RepID=A0ABT3GYN8_9RHOB|nr:helix-turn-helix transcriptional regulator [Pararhodobacter zhoushanensis]MCW1932637.1 helix-turn-helix domain-containing protein [Pararhodobacter zhoushanensis]
MSTILKLYLNAERGRQRRLAEALGVTESHVSNIANGRKQASVDVLRKIAELTGLQSSDLLGAAEPAGLAEQVVPYTSRSMSQETTLDAYLAPKTRHRAMFMTKTGEPLLGILPGDVLVIDMRNPPRPGNTVLAAVISGDTSETRILRYAPPFLLSGDPTEDPISEADARIQGAVVAVARGHGL